MMSWGYTVYTAVCKSVGLCLTVSLYVIGYSVCEYECVFVNINLDKVEH